MFTKFTNYKLLLSGIASVILFYICTVSSFQAAIPAVPSIVSVTFITKSVTGGTKVTGVVTLDTAPVINGFTVPLASDNPAAHFGIVSFPGGSVGSVIVPAGRTSASFAITTLAVERDTTVNITAGTREAPKSGVFTIQPPILKSVTTSFPKILGGQTVRGMVELTGPAPVVGIKLFLTSNPVATARVPSEVTVINGSTSASFEIATSAVSGADTNVAITATSSSGKSTSANLIVTLPLIPELVSMTTLPFATATNTHSINLTFDRTLSSSQNVQMSSSNSSVISVTSNITFQSGITTFGFAVTPKQVASETPVTITMVSGNSTKSVTITVRPIKIETFSLSNSSITGGAGAVATLALNAPRNDDTIINLTSSNPVISIPSSKTLPARSSSSNPATVTFDIFSQSVTSPRSVTITATPQSGPTEARTVQLTVSPVTIASLTLAKTRCDVRINCPRSIEGTVTLNWVAPPDGMSIALSSDRTESATVPNTILIPSGQTTAFFNVSTPFNAYPDTVIIRATSGSASTKTATLELVKTSLNVETVILDSAQAVGGSPITGTVTIKQAVALGSQVTPITPTEMDAQVNLRVSSSGGSAELGSFQSTRLTVLRGQTTANFTFTPLAVAADKIIQIQALVDTNEFGGGILVSAPLTVKPATIQSLTLSQTNVQGGQTVTGTIQMSGPVPFSNAVAVTSSDPNAAPISGPSFFAGNQTGTFQINTPFTVTSPTPITITATFNGQTVTTPLTVIKPSVLSNVTFPAERIFGRLETNLRVELDGPAPSSGALITLGSSAPLILAQRQITIPAGQSFTTIQLTPNSPSNPVQLSVSAIYLNQNKQGSVTVEALYISFCDLIGNPVGGQRHDCTLKIINDGMVAPQGGFQFDVTSTNPAVLSAPATLTIPAGQNSIAFQITTQEVTQNTNVMLRISNNVGSSNRSITITPK